MVLHVYLKSPYFGISWKKVSDYTIFWRVLFSYVYKNSIILKQSDSESIMKAGNGGIRKFYHEKFHCLEISLLGNFITWKLHRRKILPREIYPP